MKNLYQIHALKKENKTRPMEIGANKVNDTMMAGGGAEGYGQIEETRSVKEEDDIDQENTVIAESDVSGTVAAHPAFSVQNPPEPHNPRKRARNPANDEEDLPAPRKRGARTRKGLKKGEQIGEPSHPGVAIKKYNTQRYQEYDWEADLGLPEVNNVKYKGNYAVFDSFKLLTGPIPHNIGPADIPKYVRLDDRWVAWVSLRFNKKQISEYWPAEFDTNGMLRATRVPLGHACLIWVTKGHKDVDGIPAEEDGLFYGWYRGLQPLYGEEKFEDYMVRPSHEQTKCMDIGFKVSCPAEGGKDRADFQTVRTVQKMIVMFIGKN